MKLEPLGDCAVLATLGEKIEAGALGRVLGLARAIETQKARGVVEVVPAYSTVTVYYDPLEFSEPGDHAYQHVCRVIEAAAGATTSVQGRLVEIPVCYGGDLGPDLARVAEHTGLGPETVVERHAGARYLVHAIGFAPGFPYLGGLPPELATPRRESPRIRVQAGSVGIAGLQTGVYPIASPGGWQIIGRTPLSLFGADRQPPSLLAPGDTVQFRAISREEFESWK